MTSVVEILRELDRLRSELESLPKYAFAERARLQSKHQELRAEAARLRTEHPSPEAAEAEFGRLERRRQELLGRRLGLADKGGGGGPSGGGIEARDVQRLNRAIDDSSGLEEVEQRIAQLRRLLGRLREAGD